MVAVAQLVEPRIVIPVVAGSSPVSHPSVFPPGDVSLTLFAARSSFLRSALRLLARCYSSLRSGIGQPGVAPLDPSDNLHLLSSLVVLEVR